MFSTPPRIFRHVATLVGLQLVTSFVSVAKSLGQSRETAQRQLNAEKKKRKDGARIESLNKQLSEKHEKITMVEEMMRKVFTGFVSTSPVLEYPFIDLGMIHWSVHLQLSFLRSKVSRMMFSCKY